MDGLPEEAAKEGRRLDRAEMTENGNKTISHLEALGYAHIECRCRICKSGSTASPFKLIRMKRPKWLLSTMTLDQLAAKMHCNKCGGKDFQYNEWRQSDALGYTKSWSYPDHNGGSGGKPGSG